MGTVELEEGSAEMLLGSSENLPFIGNRVYLADHKKRFLSSSVGYWLRLQIKLTLSHFVLMAKFQNLERWILFPFTHLLNRADSTPLGLL